MTTIQGENGKIVKFSFSNHIHEVDRTTFIPEMPLIVCDNKRDAEYIQSEINAIASEASKKSLKKTRSIL